MRWGLAACAGGFLLLCTPAQAEVGKASASPGEWFLGFTAGGGAAWGPERQAFQEIGVAPAPLEGIVDVGDVNFDEGAFFVLGAQVGYVLAQPSSLVDRIEFNVDLRMLSRDMTPNPEGTALVIAQALSWTISAMPFPNLGVDASDDERDVDLRLSFKKALAETEDHIVLASLEPFIRFQDTDGKVAVGEGVIARKDDISADYYGLQAALEIESPLTETMKLIGRASAGAYHVDADIDSHLESSSSSAGSPASDSASAWGGRFGGALGVKVPLHYAGASLSLMGTIDYLTDVATIDHARLTEGEAVQVIGRTEAGFDDALDLGGRVELVFPLR